MTTTSRLLAAAVLGLLVVPLAHAQRQLPLWEAGVGVAGLTLPDYRGSDERTNYVFPLPYFIYRGEFFKLDRDGAQGILFKRRGVELDISLNIGNPVKSDKNAARQDMPDLNPTFEIGPRLLVDLVGSRFEKFQLQFQLPVRTVTEIDWPHLRHVGWLANPLLNADFRDIRTSGWDLGMQAGPLFADRSYHQYYYQVDPQFARPDRPAYEAKGGYSGTQFSVGLSKRFDKWWVGGFVRYYDLHGAEFEDSPLVKQRSALLAGFGVAYIFAASGTRVLAER